MKNLTLLAVATALLFSACSKKSKTVTADTILLHAGDGYVATPSPHYYKITKDEVLEDTVVFMNYDDVFNKPVPAEKSVLAKGLLTKITRGMLDENDKRYESERIADAATNTITATVDGKTYRWYITEDVESLPKHVRDFGQAVNDAVMQLEQN
jgi:hypothetical protein